MNVADVMDQLGDALDTITGLRVFRYPPETLTPPAGVVAYPETAQYAEAYGRGMDRLMVPIVVVLGKVSDRSSAIAMAAYLSGSGARSIKAVVDNYGSYTAMDSVTVTSAETDVFTMNGVDHIAATFEVDVVGRGGS